MKKVLVLLGIAILFGACASGKGRVNYKKPESVALVFIKSIVRLDMDGAKRVATDDTKSVLVLLETLTASMPQKEKEEMIAKAEEESKLLKKANCIIENDIANCTICCDENGIASAVPLQLKKIDKKWLVDMGKEELMSGKK